jgi:hypothetical protein
MLKLIQTSLVSWVKLIGKTVGTGKNRTLAFYQTPQQQTCFADAE